MPLGSNRKQKNNGKTTSIPFTPKQSEFLNNVNTQADYVRAGLELLLMFKEKLPRKHVKHIQKKPSKISKQDLKKACQKYIEEVE